ncbi:MAG: DNA replication/repair protein RecF [Marinifilaceae bacterium]
MYLKQLSIVNFKNIGESALQFSNKYNCFIGNNGMGKTNVLDALYHLSMCKSYFNLRDGQNIRHGEPFFVLQATYMRANEEVDIYCGLKSKGKKVIKRNKKAYNKYSEHIGFLPLVMVSPEDSVLIDGSSEERRKLIDTIISQNDKTYLNALIAYSRALQQRNALLKNYAGKTPDYDMLDIWDDALAESCEQIRSGRIRFLEEFAPLFQHYYEKVSLGRERVQLQYKPSVSEGISVKDALRERIQKDCILTYTTVGAHRDDLELTIGDYPLRKFGSQGQKKSFLIAMKLAQYVWLHRATGIKPLLLLDDIFDKLDTDRVRSILELVADDEFGQIFITDTNRSHIDALLQGQGAESCIFRVVNGEIIDTAIGD